MDEALAGLGELLEEAAGYSWEVEFPSFSEYVNRLCDLFSAVLSWIMANDFLRLFAVFAVLIVVLNLLGFLVRAGRSLAC